MFPVAFILLLVAFIQNFLKSIGVSYQRPVLEPVIPGLNLPASELGYYSISLVVCSIFHELGHALASVKQDVNLVNVGVNVLFILPVAYVNLSSEKLNALNPWKKLKILCAGVWHNLVLGLLAYLMFCSLPFVFSSIYYTNNGISVSYISRNSPLYGTRGLQVGDIITKLNECNINNDASWFSCLEQMQLQKPSFCVDTDLVHTLDESVPLHHVENNVYDCCDSGKTGHLCFEYIDNNDGILELPPHICLPVRTIIEKSPHYCTSSKFCANNLHCIRPLLYNNTNLFKIKRINKADVIYIGLIGDLTQTVQVSGYVPRHIFSSTVLPDAITKFLKYIIVFSIGLAIVNVIPCVCMDGQHITASLIEALFGEALGSKQSINVVSLIICIFGTVLLIVHCIINFYRLYFT